MIVHFSAHISKWELVCKFGVIFHIFIILASVHGFMYETSDFFYSVITFSYTKCFVHSYTVDVVCTLSYWNSQVYECPWWIWAYTNPAWCLIHRCIVICLFCSRRLRMYYSMMTILWRDRIIIHGFKAIITWWRHQMETFSALLALCAGNSPVTGEFPAQRPVRRSFDIFFDLCQNKRLSKQS